MSGRSCNGRLCHAFVLAQPLLLSRQPTIRFVKSSQPIRTQPPASVSLQSTTLQPQLLQYLFDQAYLTPHAQPERESLHPKEYLVIPPQLSFVRLSLPFYQSDHSLATSYLHMEDHTRLASNHYALAQLFTLYAGPTDLSAFKTRFSSMAIITY